MNKSELAFSFRSRDPFGSRDFFCAACRIRQRGFRATVLAFCSWFPHSIVRSHAGHDLAVRGDTIHTLEIACRSRGMLAVLIAQPLLFLLSTLKRVAWPGRDRSLGNDVLTAEAAVPIDIPGPSRER